MRGSPTLKKQYMEAGEFVTTHGIAGELRLYPWADTPHFFQDFSKFFLGPGGETPLEILSVRPHKNICIVKLSGIDSIEEARPFIGKTVYISRDEVQLPEGRFFIQDLLGAQVIDGQTGEEYGIIRSVTHPGWHDVYEIQRPDHSICLFPAAEPFVESIDLDAGVVKVRPIPGMFGDAPV